MFALGGNTGTLDMKYLNYKQKKREVICAVTLRDLLRQFEMGDETESEQESNETEFVTEFITTKLSYGRRN